MSITAAQLVAEVAINGADSGISNLTKIGDVADGAQSALDATSSAASSFAETFSGATAGIIDGNSMMLDSYDELASGGAESGSVLIDILSEISDTLHLMNSNVVDASESAVGSMADMADAIVKVQFATENMDDSVTAGLEDLASGFGNVSASAEASAVSVAEAGTSASESSGGFMELFNNIGQSIFWFQNMINVAGQVASALFAPAISAEEVSSSLVIFTGSAAKAKQELQQLSDFAAHTPFETATIDDAALKMQSVGINAKDVIPDILSLGDALDATGRISSADLGMIVDNFDKIKTEGHLSTQVMNSFALQGIDAWSVLEKQTGKTHAQLAQLISSGLYPADQAMKDLTAGIEKSPLYHGQMANDVENFTGAFGTMKSNFDQVLVSFGSPILKGVEPIINNLSAAFSSQGFKDFAGSIGKGVATALNDIGTGVHNVSQFFGAFDLTGITYAFNNLKSVVEKIAAPFEKLGSNKAASEFFTSLKNALSKDIVTAIKDVSGFINGLAENLGKLASNKDVTGFLGNLKSGFQQVSQIVGGELGKDFKSFMQTAQQVGQWFQTTMLPAIQQAMPGFEHLGSVIATTVVPSLAKIWAVGQQVMRDVMPPLTKAFETIAPIVIKVGGFLADNLGKALQFIMPFAVQAAQALGQFAGEIIARVIPIVQQIYDGIKAFLDWIAPYWPQIWATITSALTNTWSIIKGVIQIGWSLISGIIKVGLDLLSGNWSQAWGDIKSTFSGVWDGIKSIVSGAWGFIGGAVKGGINGVIDMINNFINAIDSMHVNVPGIGNVGFNIADIPHLKLGGLIGSAGFADVGEDGPERVWLPAGAQVVPNSQAFGSGAQQASDRPIILVVDGRVMARGVLPHMVNELRNMGVQF